MRRGSPIRALGRILLHLFTRGCAALAVLLVIAALTGSSGRPERMVSRICAQTDRREH